MDCREKITRLLSELGMPASLTGYEYVVMAVEFAMFAKLYGKTTTVLYPFIASHFSTTGPKVERCIRHAVEVSWQRGNLDKIQEIFGYTVPVEKDRPTNMEFISGIANFVAMPRS